MGEKIGLWVFESILDKIDSVFASCKAYLAKFWLWNHPATSRELERHSVSSWSTTILQTKLWIQVGQDAMETPDRLIVTLGRKARILISVGFDLGKAPAAGNKATASLENP